MVAEAATRDEMEGRSTSPAAAHECLISRRDNGSLNQSNINISITLGHLPSKANKEDLNNEWACIIRKLKCLSLSNRSQGRKMRCAVCFRPNIVTCAGWTEHQREPSLMAGDTQAAVGSAVGVKPSTKTCSHECAQSEYLT